MSQFGKFESSRLLFRLNFPVLPLVDHVVLSQVGDGTTSVVLLAGEFLKQCKPFIEEGVHAQIIVRSFRKATYLAVEKIKEIAVHTRKDNPE